MGESTFVNTGWGLLGPEIVASTRRTRTLGLGATVRRFNDLAVPGLGNIWYGKQLLLATLGVKVAELARQQGARAQNIEVANAIEAVACLMAFKSNGWGRDPRMRGISKLQGRGEDLRFQRVRQRNFYVNQPMRMATVQALPALGFVEAASARFNAFSCTDQGTHFLEQALLDYRPYNRAITEHLSLWVRGDHDQMDTEMLRRALSPMVPIVDDALPLLRERLLQGGPELPGDKERRINALAWVDEERRAIRISPTWEIKPHCIAVDHWQDLISGARFFGVRNLAIALLDQLENYIANQALGQSFSLRTEPPSSLIPFLDGLAVAAHAFLDLKHVDTEANLFCRECNDTQAALVLRSLVARDGHVLRLVGDDVRPGPAFQKKAPVPDEEIDIENDSMQAKIPLPEGISVRVRNLYLLNLDLNGELNNWLKPGSQGLAHAA